MPVQNLPPKRILVVEDERPIGNALNLKLKKLGYDSQVVGNGFEAVEKLTSEKFDLIITDLVMPRMDGFEMLHYLRQFGVNTPVIVLSNLGQKVDYERAKEYGVIAYFIKSNTSLSQLVNLIHNSLQQNNNLNALEQYSNNLISKTSEIWSNKTEGIKPSVPEPTNRLTEEQIHKELIESFEKKQKKPLISPEAQKVSKPNILIRPIIFKEGKPIFVDELPPAVPTVAPPTLGWEQKAPVYNLGNQNPTVPPAAPPAVPPQPIAVPKVNEDILAQTIKNQTVEDVPVDKAGLWQKIKNFFGKLLPKRKPKPTEISHPQINNTVNLNPVENTQQTIPTAPAPVNLPKAQPVASQPVVTETVVQPPKQTVADNPSFNAKVDLEKSASSKNNSFSFIKNLIDAIKDTFSRRQDNSEAEVKPGKKEEIKDPDIVRHEVKIDEDISTKIPMESIKPIKPSSNVFESKIEKTREEKIQEEKQREKDKEELLKLHPVISGKDYVGGWTADKKKLKKVEIFINNLKK